MKLKTSCSLPQPTLQSLNPGLEGNAHAIQREGLGFGVLGLGLTVEGMSESNPVWNNGQDVQLGSLN